MSDCLFCRIAIGEIPSDKVYEDDLVVAFRDIAPVAPVHVLVTPKQHFANLADISSDSELTAHLAKTAAAIGTAECVDGFRVVFNTGADGGQTVDHVHAHVLGARQLQWPPG